MNCLAHAVRFLADPYLAAGTCVPDWLVMVDRKTRVRRPDAERFLESGQAEPIAGTIARGIMQHLDDDAWFHRTRAFAELSMSFAAQARDHLEPDESFRPSFLGHIAVELLLDACIAERHPSAIDEFYRALSAIDPQRLQSTVNTLAAQPTDRLAAFLPHFINVRFLYDYMEDAGLLMRLNGVMSRVKLPLLPGSVVPLLADWRQQVRARQEELLVAW